MQKLTGSPPLLWGSKFRPVPFTSQNHAYGRTAQTVPAGSKLELYRCASGDY